jgi:autotransporter-associated beta strand protein
MKAFLVVLLVCPLFFAVAFAGDATWKVNTVSNDWNTAENWRPETIPNSTGATATFGVSHTTTVLCQKSPDGTYADTYVGDVIFAPDASAYTIRITPDPDVIYPSLIEFHRNGIINNSGSIQNFVAANSGTTKESGRIYFMGTASAGGNVVITNEGGASAIGDGYYGGFTEIGYNVGDTASAGNATFVNNGGTVDGSSGGSTSVLDASTAEAATFISNPGAVSGAKAGYTWVALYSPGNIHNSTFIANAATVVGAEGGWAEIDGGTCEGASFIANGAAITDAQAGQIYVYGGDGYAIFIGKGGEADGAEGGLLDFFSFPFSDDTIAIAEPGTNGGLGGHIVLEKSTAGEFGRFRLLGNGLLDLSPVTDRIVSVGSIEGDGFVSLAGHVLTVGANDVDVSFNGVIQDTGSVQKLGAGTLILGGANTYVGQTIVAAGTLRITNASGSATGIGPVRVDAGTLSGNGTVSGGVTMGTSVGVGAILAPGVEPNQLGSLTFQNTLTFKRDSTYTYKLNTISMRTDHVVARRVSIENGAQFNFQAIGDEKLPFGTIFTVIESTGSTRINGRFSNLPNHSIFTAGSNRYQVRYEGGDGNDLTLTVVR